MASKNNRPAFPASIPSRPVLLVLSLLAVAFVAYAALRADYSSIGSLMGGSRNYSCVGVIHLDGEIGYGGGASADGLRALLDEANADGSVGAVVLVINSPGGSAAASKEIYDSISASGKPTVAYLRDVAASGGYYAAAGSDYVVANPNTITGSIGARADLLNYEGLFGKVGLRQESVKSGGMKDMGAGYRNLTDAERAVFSGIINETFDNFASDVAAGRGERLNATLFASVLDARVLSAKQALAVGLVDSIGGRGDALMAAAALGNVTVAGSLPGECEFSPPQSLLSLLSGASGSFAQSLVSELSARRLSLRLEA